MDQGSRRDLDALGEEARSAARESLLAFAKLVKRDYLVARHASLLIQHLEALERGDIRRLMVFMPPRHAKTLHCSRLFPAWFLGRDPSRQVVLSSYAADLAEESSRDCRAYVESDLYPFDAEIAPDASRKEMWSTTAGGLVRAVGVGSGLTGFGAHLLAIDDPHKDRADADSETSRKSVWAWYQEVARTRLMPGGLELLAMTRWHQDDLAGRILNSPAAKDWTVLSMSALAEDEGDPLGRRPGEALWPARYPAHEMPSVERGEMSQRAWDALYQQRPTAAGGSVFRRDWMQLRYSDDPMRLRRQLPHVIMTVDGSWKTGASNDWSACAVWGASQSGYCLLHVFRARVPYPELERHVVRLYNEWRPSAVLIEDAASGIAVIQSLQRTRLPVVPYKTRGVSKIARAEAVAPLFEAGKVVLPQSAPWLECWIEEHCDFPSGRFDDQVDTTSMALGRLSDSTGATVRRGIFCENARQATQPCGNPRCPCAERFARRPDMNLTAADWRRLQSIDN
jgi:predicted phage terminase large subunit-like protein